MTQGEEEKAWFINPKNKPPFDRRQFPKSLVNDIEWQKRMDFFPEEIEGLPVNAITEINEHNIPQEAPVKQPADTENEDFQKLLEEEEKENKSNLKTKK